MDGMLFNNEQQCPEYYLQSNLYSEVTPGTDKDWSL